MTMEVFLSVNAKIPILQKSEQYLPTSQHTKKTLAVFHSGALMSNLYCVDRAKSVKELNSGSKQRFLRARAF